MSVTPSFPWEPQAQATKVKPAPAPISIGCGILLLGRDESSRVYACMTLTHDGVHVLSPLCPWQHCYSCRRILLVAARVIFVSRADSFFFEAVILERRCICVVRMGSQLKLTRLFLFFANSSTPGIRVGRTRAFLLPTKHDEVLTRTLPTHPPSLLFLCLPL